MKSSVFFLFFLAFFFHTHAQFNSGYIAKNHVAVVEDGDTLENPWSGGLNNPIVSEIDINLDGHMDIFMYDLDGKKRKAFIYHPSDETYHWDSTAYKAFPDVATEYMLLRDYNNDQKMDAFVRPPSGFGLMVYKNVSDTALKFELVETSLGFKRPEGGTVKVFAEFGSIPAIEDMDDDGDLDFITQISANASWLPASDVLIYIKGMSQELYGHSDSLVFELSNRCWGSITEFGDSAGWTSFDCSDTSDLEFQPSGARHGYSTITSGDFNGDGNTDILIGDSFASYLTAFFGDDENEKTTVDLSQADNNFPSYDTPINVPTLPTAYLVDLNHDGRRDMLVTPTQVSFQQIGVDTSINKEVDWYYQDIGSGSEAEFELKSKGYFGGQMIDVGTKSYPALVDLTGDGLLDMVIGNQGFKVFGGTASANLTYYENTGDASNPEFSLVTEDFAGAKFFGFGSAHPTFADIDNDGDQDMMLGDDQGYLHFFKNNGTPTQPNFSLFEAEFNNIDVDLEAHPQFFDLSTDGIPDLVVGDYYGRIQYFENTGTAEEYDFSSSPSIAKLGGIQLFNSNEQICCTTPYLTHKSDSTGRVYMFVGNQTGNVLAYGPINDVFATMTPIDSIELEASNASVTGGNLSGDLRDELIIGQQAGGLFFLERFKNVSLSASPKDDFASLDIYPNPTKDLLNIEWRNASINADVKITVTNLLGNTVLSSQSKSPRRYLYTQLSIAHLPAGIYLLGLEHQNDIHWERFIKE